jgi:hypothetical protein
LSWLGARVCPDSQAFRALPPVVFPFVSAGRHPPAAIPLVGSFDWPIALARSRT